MLPFNAREGLDCSQFPLFFRGIVETVSRLVRFDGAVAILVCKSERDLGRVSVLPSGAREEREWGLVTPLPSPR